MKRVILISLTLTILLTACASQPTLTLRYVSTDSPKPATLSTSIPPTQESRIIDLGSGGITLSVQPELEFDIDDHSINLSSQRGEHIISLNGKPYIASDYTMESFLGRYVDEMASRGGTFIQSTPYKIEIDGATGTAVNITGTFLDAPVAGKAFVISPGETFIVFGLGMSNLTMNKNEWIDTGSDIFEALLASIKFKDEVRR
jgi:hypothetical protein